jgi:hypothetical protein
MDVNLDFLDPEPLLFHSSISSVILTRLSGPTTSQKMAGSKLCIKMKEQEPTYEILI